MSKRRISRKDIRSVCAEPGAGDGLDPRYDRSGSPLRPPGRKMMQLCHQVSQTLMGVLAEQGNPVLQELLVLSVQPAGGGRLLVTVSPSPLAAIVESTVILQHLAEAHGLLRNEVASAIHRRKAPDLVFRVTYPLENPPV
jgi:ribosome-binding factor A